MKSASASLRRRIEDLYPCRMARMGRPKSDEPRTKMINTRVTEREYALLTAAAARRVVTVSEYLRTTALATARDDPPS